MGFKFIWDAAPIATQSDQGAFDEVSLLRAALLPGELFMSPVDLLEGGRLTGRLPDVYALSGDLRHVKEGDIVHGHDGTAAKSFAVVTHGKSLWAIKIKYFSEP